MKLFFALMSLTLVVSGRQISSSVFHLFDMSFNHIVVGLPGMSYFGWGGAKRPRNLTLDW